MPKIMKDRLDITQAVMAEHAVRFPVKSDIARLKQQAQPLIAAPIAPNAVVQSVQDHAGQCLFILDDDAGNFGAGVLLVPLTTAGAYSVISGNRFGHDVNLTWVCRPDEAPEAILVWALIGKSTWHSGKMLQFCRAMKREVHNDTPILAYAATQDGARIMPRIGFTRMTEGSDVYKWDIEQEKRPKTSSQEKTSPTALKPTLESVDAGKLETIVVNDHNQLLKVYALRSVVFMAGQDCPYDEEFDGNDIAGATHIMTLYEGEPVGTMRLRWFSDFVKVERACVNPRYRSQSIMAALSMFGKQLCADKGYKRILIHAQKRLKSYWEQNGFFARTGREPFLFSDFEYIEMEAHVTADNHVHIDSDPMVLNRPEGQWDRPGVLEKSQSRGAGHIKDGFEEPSQAAYYCPPLQPGMCLAA